MPYLPLDQLRRGTTGTTGTTDDDDREQQLMKRVTFLIPALVLGLAVLLSSIFVVDERQRALVLQFGQIRQVIETPGLNFKIPFIQEVVYYDDRILALDTAAIEVTPSERPPSGRRRLRTLPHQRRGAVPPGCRRGRHAGRRAAARGHHQPADP